MTPKNGSRPVTREEMRELDRIGIEKFGIPGVVLMENAGRGAAALAATLVSPPARVLILCGRGNNGGDGFVVARHLHNRGFRVQTLVVGDLRSVMTESSDAGVMARIVDAMGLEIEEMSDPATIGREMPSRVHDASLVVDAMLGTGLTGEVRGPIRVAIEQVAASSARVLALDLPSGLDANSGGVLGAAIRAEVTATFARPKRGLLSGEGPRYAGRVEVVDIGLPRELIDE